MKTRIVHSINLILALLMTGGSLAAWPGLPDEIPIHFGANGLPDRWADTTFLSWFGVPVLTILLAAGLYLVAQVLPTRPAWINLPEKDRFLKLPEAARRPVYRRIQFVTYLSATFLLVILVMVQFAVYVEAHGSTAQGLVRAVLIVAAAGSLVISTLAIVGMQRALNESWRLGAKVSSAG